VKKPLGGPEYAASFRGSHASREELLDALTAERQLSDSLAEALREYADACPTDDPTLSYRFWLKKYDASRAAK
jgi:hypothetical protein